MSSVHSTTTYNSTTILNSFIELIYKHCLYYFYFDRRFDFESRNCFILFLLKKLININNHNIIINRPRYSQVGNRSIRISIIPIGRAGLIDPRRISISLRRLPEASKFHRWLKRLVEANETGTERDFRPLLSSDGRAWTRVRERTSGRFSPDWDSAPLVNELSEFTF